MAGKKKGKKKAKKARKAARRAAKAVRSTQKAAPRRAVRKAAARRRPAPRAHQKRHQPESLRLRSAGPSFTVNDIHKSLAFYRDVLGFTPKERWEEQGELHGVEMVAGSVVFWLGQDDWKKGRDRVKGQGFRMYCATSQDIDGLAGRIKGHGVTLVEEPKDQPWGGRAFAVRDPDGFTVTFASEM